MTDTAFKHTPLAELSPGSASTVALRPLTVMTHEAQRAVAAAQDTVVAGSRRVVGTWGLDGSSSFAVPDTGLQGPGMQSHPHRDTLRLAGSIFCNRLTPGSFVAARLYFIGSGSTAVGGPPWSDGGPGGAVTLEHSWASGASTDGPHAVETVLEASPVVDSAIPAVQAGFWHQLQVIELGGFQPDDIATPATGVLWVEDLELQLEVKLRGSPRIQSVVVYERPVRAIYDHDEVADEAVNGQGPVEVPQSTVPQIEAADGATFEERRFGTHQLLRVADRHQRVVGPILMQWLAHDESSQDPLEDIEPVEVTSTTFVDLLEPVVTAYDRDRAGWITAAAHAKVHYLNDRVLIMPGGVAAVVPCRVVVEAKITGVIGTVRVQTGEYEWIDVTITSAGYTENLATGYAESQVTPDHAWGTTQVFLKVQGAGSMDVKAVAVTFGE